MLRWQSKTAIYPSAIRLRRIREEQSSSTDSPAKTRRDDQRSTDLPVFVTGVKPIMRKSSAQWTVVAKFDDRLNSKVAESSRVAEFSKHSDHIRASEDIIKKLVVPRPFSISFFFSQVVTVFTSDGLSRILRQCNGVGSFSSNGQQSGWAGRRRQEVEGCRKGHHREGQEGRGANTKGRERVSLGMVRALSLPLGGAPRHSRLGPKASSHLLRELFGV